MEDCKTTYLYNMEIFDISKKCPPGKKPTLRERRMEQSRDVQTVRTQSVFVCCWRRRSFATAWRCPDGTKHWRKLWCTLLLCFNEFTSGFSGFVSCGVLCKARPEEEGTNRKGSKDKVPTNVVWIKVDFSSSSWSEFLVSHLVSTLLIYACRLTSQKRGQQQTFVVLIARINGLALFTSRHKESFVFKMGPLPACKFTPLRKCSV